MKNLINLFIILFFISIGNVYGQMCGEDGIPCVEGMSGCATCNFRPPNTTGSPIQIPTVTITRTVPGSGTPLPPITSAPPLAGGSVGGTGDSGEAKQQRALENKLCPNTFEFQIVVKPKSGPLPSGWKVSQVSDLALYRLNSSNYFESIWNTITGQPQYAAINFQLEVGAPATFPNHVLQQAASDATYKAMKEIVMSHGFEGIATLSASGLFGKTFAELAQIHFNSVIRGGTITHKFNTKGVKPTKPKTSNGGC